MTQDRKRHLAKSRRCATSQKSPNFGLKSPRQNSCRPCGNSGRSRPPDSVPARFSVESGMAHISGFDRSQVLLLPEAVDDYVGSDNSVRFIDAFIDGLDLVEAGFVRVQPKATGRPG